MEDEKKTFEVSYEILTKTISQLVILEQYQEKAIQRSGYNVVARKGFKQVLKNVRENRKVLESICDFDFDKLVEQSKNQK